ncbi:hypothetical protein P3S68_002970 [Capsicum galapagoense]
MVIDAYIHMLRTSNSGSNTALEVDENEHPSIGKTVSIVFPSSYYGCCMRHLGENIRKDFHNGSIVHHFFKAAKAYNVDVFNDHFKQIRDMISGAATHFERVGFHQ